MSERRDIKKLTWLLLSHCRDRICSFYQHQNGPCRSIRKESKLLSSRRRKIKGWSKEHNSKMFHYKNLYHPQQRQSRLMGALARPKDYISKGPPEQIIPRHHSSKKE